MLLDETLLWSARRLHFSTLWMLSAANCRYVRISSIPYKDILLSLPNRSSRLVVSKLGCRVVFIKYLSMK